MDRRYFIVAALAGTTGLAASGTAASAAGPIGLAEVQGALGGGPVEMQRRGGRGPGGGGGRRGGGFRGGGGRRFRGGGRRWGGGGGWRRRGFYGRPYRRRYYGGPYYGGSYYGGPWGYRRRCWINRFGRRVCRRPAAVIPFPFVPFF